jgi:hypothetical protein
MTKDHFKQLEKDLWLTAERLWELSGMKPSEYSSPVLGDLLLPRLISGGLRRWTSSVRRG